MHPYVRYAIIAVVLIGGYRWYGSYERQAQTQFVELSQTFDRTRVESLLEERMRASGGIPLEARNVVATSEVVSQNGAPGLRFRMSFTAAGGQVVLNPSTDFVAETMMGEAKKAAGASRIEGRVITQLSNGQPVGLLVTGRAWFSEWQRAGMPAISTSSLPSIALPTISMPEMPSMSSITIPAMPAISMPSITIPTLSMPTNIRLPSVSIGDTPIIGSLPDSASSTSSHIRLPSISVGDAPMIGSTSPTTAAARRTDEIMPDNGTSVIPR